jgi:hypothetical protein
MKQDPFGNLGDWGPVLGRLEELADEGRLSECQPGLVRILRYKGNWRLREEVLKRIGEIRTPSEALISQVLSIIADDNIYYDARILASDALIQLLKSTHCGFNGEVNTKAQKIAKKLGRTPQPPFFDAAIKKLTSAVTLPGGIDN